MKQQDASATAATAYALGKRPASAGWAGQRAHSTSKRGRSKATEAKTSTRATYTSREGTEVIYRADMPSHPSWEAKKKLKEREGARILLSQGKKLVFA